MSENNTNVFNAPSDSGNQQSLTPSPKQDSLLETDWDKHRELNAIRSKFALASIAFVVVSTAVTLILCKETSGVVVNLLAIATMVGLACFGACGRRGIFELLKAEEDLSNQLRTLSGFQLSTAGKTPEDLYIDIISKTKNNDSKIIQALSRYEDEARAVKEKNSKSAKDTPLKDTPLKDTPLKDTPLPETFKYCDIADYINDSMLDDICNVSYNDLVAGALTGIGILGTFVGLVFGLMGFNTSNADEMMKTIVPLIEGIKVAFLTSIFGMVSSLAYNVFYKKQLSRATDVKNEFITLFYKIISPKPDNTAWTRLIRLQEAQEDNLKHLAEDMSSKVGTKVGTAIGTELRPILEDMQKSMNSMSSKVVQSQAENAARVTEEMIRNLSEKLGGPMENLGKTVDSMNVGLGGFSKELMAATSKIVEEGQAVSEMAGKLQETVLRLDEYISHIERAQRELNQTSESARESFERYSTALEKQAGDMSKALELEQSTIGQLVTQSQQSGETAQKLADQLTESSTSFSARMEKTIGDIWESIQSMQNASTELGGKLSEAGAMMADASEQLAKTTDDELDKALHNMDKSLGIALEHFSGTLLDMKKTIEEARDATDQVPKVVGASSKHLEKEVAEMARQTRDYVQEINGAIESIKALNAK